VAFRYRPPENPARSSHDPGLARVDFLLDKHSGEFFINEVNSIPGFTEYSMNPLRWQVSGLRYPALLDRSIEFALDRHRTNSALETRFQQDT
jgi:D-alanine-D-alanine ligase